MAKPNELPQQGDAIRRFNRFYTRAIGTLPAHVLGSAFTLAEARVLYQISRNERTTATQFAGSLGLDAGYLSRILAGFAEKRLITRTASSKDARESFLSLTRRGKKEFSSIDEKAAAQAIALLKPPAVPDRQKIVSAMSAIESILSVEQRKSASTAGFILRPHRPGDMEWVVAAARHSLCAGIRLGRTLRGAGGAHRSRFRGSLLTRAASVVGLPNGMPKRPAVFF
jgi:DNA-binding MarR family transcriptional regulator